MLMKVEYAHESTRQGAVVVENEGAVTQVDKTWRNLMERLPQNPSCLSLAADVNVLPTLQNANQVKSRMIQLILHLILGSSSQNHAEVQSGGNVVTS
jgi:hypothetical protein